MESSCAGDTDVIFRQYSHHALFQKLMPKPGGEQLPGVEDYIGIESGLANYFCCSFNNNPVFAAEAARVKNYGPWFMKLDNQRSFKEIKRGTFSDSIGEVWGGAFWELRMRLGRETIDKLLFAAWDALDMDKVRNDRGGIFLKNLLEADARLAEGVHGTVIREVFEGRGFPLKGNN